MRTRLERNSTHAAFSPLEQVLVVRQSPKTHQRESVAMQWGLVPSWAERPEIGNRLTHARAKTVATKIAFQEAFRHRRCLIVVDSFEVGQRKAIQMQDGRPFGVGGIWERWQQAKEILDTCAVITTESNSLVQPINDRMPVIVMAEDYDRWLDPEVFDAKELQRMMRPFSAEEMTVVSSS